MTRGRGVKRRKADMLSREILEKGIGETSTRIGNIGEYRVGR